MSRNTEAKILMLKIFTINTPNKKKSTIAIFINLNGFSKNIFEITNHIKKLASNKFCRYFTVKIIVPCF
jgi:hypothetical protein